MKYFIGALAGLAWGALAAFLNYGITKRSLARSDTSSVVSANLLRNVVDIAALAAVFLVRKLLPFSYEATLIATAIALSLLTFFFTFRLSKKMK